MPGLLVSRDVYALENVHTLYWFFTGNIILFPLTFKMIALEQNIWQTVRLICHFKMNRAPKIAQKKNQ